MNALRTPAFAALGHQADWTQIATLVATLRPPSCQPPSDAEIRATVGWIPPRTVARLQVAAAPGARAVDGVYIETFITPDELAARPTHRLLDKVRDGVAAAAHEGARVVTLGGFTSILLESMRYQPPPGLALTTGNTLTAALIVRGVEEAARLLDRSLARETLLVIGATGDIGSACARCFAGRCRRLLLAARNHGRLETIAAELRPLGPVDYSIDAAQLLAQASVVIAVASTAAPSFPLDACHPDAIVCDAGYPQNMRAVPSHATGGRRVFHGGMGALGGGIHSADGVLERIYRFPARGVAHGCLLEGAVLAIAQRFESFSTGRGRITPARVEEMWRIATAAGVRLAPLFDRNGLWPEVVS